MKLANLIQGIAGINEDYYLTIPDQIGVHYIIERISCQGGKTKRMNCTSNPECNLGQLLLEGDSKHDQPN